MANGQLLFCTLVALMHYTNGEKMTVKDLARKTTKITEKMKAAIEEAYSTLLQIQYIRHF